MTRRDHALIAGASCAGAVLAIFQVWYVALPLDRAARFDWCQWRYLDCFESLHRQEGLLPVLAALAAVYLVKAVLAGLALGDASPRSDAWLGIARLLSFPASGLAVYAVLSDYLEWGKTSPSALLLVLLSVAMAVHAVVKGGLAVSLRAGGLVPAVVVLAAAPFGFFLEGAAGAARESDRAKAAAWTAAPSALVADFEPEIPREGAARIGDPTATTEVLLFLDPAQEASRKLLREALAADVQDAVLQVYLKDRALSPGARALLESAARGDPLPPLEATPLSGRIFAAANIDRYPTAITKGGRKSGDFTLASVLAR
jgi:hypothetical protein